MHPELKINNVHSKVREREINRKKKINENDEEEKYYYRSDYRL